MIIWYRIQTWRETRTEKRRKRVYAQWRACSRNGTRPVTVPVEVVDLGRREENETLEQGRQMMSFFSAAAFLSLSLTFLYFLSLSIFRALPFESPRHGRISTRQRSYSSLDRASSRRAFVVRLSFILTSSSERNERPRDEESFALAGLVSLTVGGAQFFFLHLSFLPFSPPPSMNHAIALTTLSLVLALGALLPSSFSPFSLVSHLSVSDIFLVFLSFCSYRSSYAISFSFALLCPPFSTLSLSLPSYILRPSSSSSLSAFLAQRTGARISFSFLPLQH